MPRLKKTVDKVNQVVDDNNQKINLEKINNALMTTINVLETEHNLQLIELNTLLKAFIIKMGGEIVIDNITMNAANDNNTYVHCDIIDNNNHYTLITKGV